MSACRVELALPEAFAACFALIPELAGSETLLFAARDADGTLAGVGGVVWRSWARPSGMPAWIVVLPDRRRRGVGRALLAAMRAAAASEDAALISFHPLDETSEAARFAAACGAFAAGRQFFFEGDARKLHVTLAPLIARLRDRIPVDARVVPLAEAPASEVKWLVAAEMATPPPQIERMLDEAASASPDVAIVDFDRSCVLMIGEEVGGALLSRRVPDRIMSAVVCNVIAPRWRFRWANALLLERFTGRTIDEGCYQIAFDCAEDVRDTIGLARRSGSDRVAVRSRFRYAAASVSERRR